MAFSTGHLDEITTVAGGERWGETHFVLNSTLLENGLKIGRFAKLEAGRIDNFDGSPAPLVAGVVLRNAANAVEDIAAYDSALTQQIEYARGGLVSVDVKSGETPALFGRVYASNDGDASDGLASATPTDVAVDGEFIAEISSGVWLVYLWPQDASDGLLEDPGDAGALQNGRNGTVALTTTGAQTRTLALPTAPNLTLSISMDVDGGDAVLTVEEPFNQAGNDIITFNTAGDTVVLKSVQVGSVLVWRLVVNDGAVLSTGV